MIIPFDVFLENIVDKAEALRLGMECGPTGDSALERILVNLGEKLERKDRATVKQEKGPGSHAVADDRCE